MPEGAELLKAELDLTGLSQSDADQYTRIIQHGEGDAVAGLPVRLREAGRC